MRTRLPIALVFLCGMAGADDPKLIGPRRGDARAKALVRNGGNGTTERAVAAGLDWLARHQSPGGLWDADGFHAHCEDGGEKCTGIGKGQHGEAMPCPFDEPISALALLAFLGQGHLPDAKESPHRDVVKRSLQALRSTRTGWGRVLALQAFAEAEGMTRQGTYREQVQSGVDWLLGRRQKDGAWGYAAPYRPGSDVPFTALAVQALVAAEDAGIELPRDLRSGIVRYLNSLEVKKGRLAYLKQGRAYGYTPTTSNAHCGAAIRELLGAGLGDPKHKAHLALILKSKPVWKLSFKDVKVKGRGTIRVQVGNLSMYQWWYGTVALFHANKSWRSWFNKTRGVLVTHQKKAHCARGSWDPKGTYERQTGGRVFATALGVLMLEQPYRHRRRSTD